MFNRIFNALGMKKKKTNYNKEQIRGTIKEIMRTRGLRSISINNYNKWLDKKIDEPWLHSIKINMEDGYLYMHGYRKNDNLRSGSIIDHPTEDMYLLAYSYVKEILENEDKIPSSQRRNILVKMCR